MGAYAVNFVIPEGTDTETVRDISLKKHLMSAVLRVRGVDPNASHVSQAERMVKRSRVDF